MRLVSIKTIPALGETPGSISPFFKIASSNPSTFSIDGGFRSAGEDFATLNLSCGLFASHLHLSKQASALESATATSDQSLFPFISTTQTCLICAPLQDQNGRIWSRQAMLSNQVGRANIVNLDVYKSPPASLHQLAR